MARFLVVFGTTEGHTTTIASRIAETMRSGGHTVDLFDSKAVRKQILAPDIAGVIVGGSVHAGEHQSSLREFVKEHRELLERLPSAFFSVSLAAADHDAEAAAETKAMVDKFVRETGWQPRQVEYIAGALVYTQYNFFIRRIMKHIVKEHGHADLDTSRDYEYTDWEAVEQFAREFAAKVVASSPVAATA